MTHSKDPFYYISLCFWRCNYKKEIEKKLRGDMLDNIAATVLIPFWLKYVWLNNSSVLFFLEFIGFMIINSQVKILEYFYFTSTYILLLMNRHQDWLDNSSIRYCDIKLGFYWILKDLGCLKIQSQMVDETKKKKRR